MLHHFQQLQNIWIRKIIFIKWQVIVKKLIPIIIIYQMIPTKALEHLEELLKPIYDLSIFKIKNNNFWETQISLLINTIFENCNKLLIYKDNYYKIIKMMKKRKL
ncbi:unnamed protein product [Paramecium sonneborni]|uniref:Uncharacterized protein n=1 Tax=Paramecium sonneborni TaxID=65129 RepID=A0A8S1QCE9_9CILI|nr:unnamed protein product [Paramecium sonneborni]